jgi:hypothetical protein
MPMPRKEIPFLQRGVGLPESPALEKNPPSSLPNSSFFHRVESRLTLSPQLKQVGQDVKAQIEFPMTSAPGSGLWNICER